MRQIPDNAVIRFHAYSDPANQWVIGQMTELQNGYGAAVIRPLRTFNDDSTLWRVKHVGDDYFELRWVADGGGNPLRLAFVDDGEALRLGAERQGPYLFTTDYLDETWFALNNWDHSRVADINEERLFDGNYVISYPWHDGDNQKWRAEVIS